MTSRYEWDEDKNDRNLRAHGVAFPEAIKVFDDLGAVEEYDATHSTYDEPRYSRIGFSGTRLLFVVFTLRQGKTRIIHARKADRVMEKYMSSTKKAKKLWTKREFDEQHRRDQRAGVPEEFLYRPDRAVAVPKDKRHDARPGETDLRNVKVAIHIKLDADIVEFFKARASEPDAAPYQTQINNALREAMEARATQTSELLVTAVAGKLLRDPTFIQSVRTKTRRRA